MLAGEALELLRALLLFISGGEPDSSRLRDIACLATNVWYEARGSPFVDKLAVAQVVVNRMRDPAHPNTVCGVVFAPGQFSWTADEGAKEVRISNRIERDAWLDSIVAAVTALDGQTPDLALGATHYHAASVSPQWAKALELIAGWGGHRYYRDPRSAAFRTAQLHSRQAKARVQAALPAAKLPKALPRLPPGSRGLDGFWARAAPMGFVDSPPLSGQARPFAWLQPAAGGKVGAMAERKGDPTRLGLLASPTRLKATVARPPSNSRTEKEKPAR